MNIFISVLFAAMASTAPIATAKTATQACTMEIGFENQTAGWEAVNDGVMGGKSSGGSDVQNSLLVFEGVLNTDGGGFSSVRTPMQPGDLAGAKGLTLRVKSDGRAYKITMRTNKRNKFRAVAFNADIPVTPAGEWTTVTADFSGVKASVWGRPLSNVTFDPAKVDELGIIIADGKDGPFRLEVDRIKSCD